MNERIRDLQIQAFAECKTFEDDKIRTDEVFERFAELIVRECAKRSAELGNPELGQGLMEHFGVEG